MDDALQLNRRRCVNPPRSGALNLARRFDAGNDLKYTAKVNKPIRGHTLIKLTIYAQSSI